MKGYTVIALFLVSLLTTVALVGLAVVANDFFYSYPGACTRGVNPLDPYDCVPGWIDLLSYLSVLVSAGTTLMSALAAVLQLVVPGRSQSKR